MVQKVQGVQDAEFLISEANGHYSREEVIIVSGQNLKAGQVLEVASTTKRTAYLGTTNPALGILFAAVDASAGDVVGVAIVRNAEVSTALLTDWDAGAGTDLPTILPRVA